MGGVGVGVGVGDEDDDGGRRRGTFGREGEMCGLMFDRMETPLA